jgi:hypothetical protein
MPREKASVTPLQTRRQLLLLESDLNRVQLMNDWNKLGDGVNHLKQNLGNLGAKASASAALWFLFSLLRGCFVKRDQKRPANSWWSRLLGGMRTGALLWSMFRRPPE